MHGHEHGHDHGTYCKRCFSFSSSHATRIRSSTSFWTPWAKRPDPPLNLCILIGSRVGKNKKNKSSQKSKKIRRMAELVHMYETHSTPDQPDTEARERNRQQKKKNKNDRTQRRQNCALTPAARTRFPVSPRTQFVP